MVTGRPPFLGDDSIAIIGQHINTPPVAPTWHNSECPRALDALILRLPVKNPSERPESANDVLSALDAIDLSTSAELPAASVDEAHALDSLAGGVFVGRQQEMGELIACLEDALSGRGRLVTLVGEPGIGKSRTAQELTTYAGLRGAQVMWGRSYEEQWVPPYWPWVQAIRSYVRESDPEQLLSEMGFGAADIAEVVSDVKDRLPGLPSAPHLEPEQARFRLFYSIADFLKTASQRQPLVLVLDDLHWADQPSLALLQFVARELSGTRLLIIGTYRDMELSRRHPLAEALGELSRERLFQRVLLRGLTQEDVGRFVEMTSGHSAPRGLVEAVHTQTEGNPLFVTEVVRLLVQEGELSAEMDWQIDSWTIRIPEGVQEVIGRRLNRLSRRCNEALTVASIVGREFTLAQLRPLVEEVSEDRLLEILAEALAARVIEESPQSVGRCQFTHALIQETLTAELSLTRRVRLHARIARSSEDLYGDNAEAHAPELAHHYSQAEAVTGTEKLVHYSLLAGERALASYAWEEAQAHFQRVLTVKEVHSDTTSSESELDSETASALLGLGSAQLARAQRDQVAEAVANLRRVYEYFVEVGNVGRAVAAATYPLSYLAGRFTVGPMVSQALTLVPSDSLDAGRLYAAQAHVLGIEELDYTGAQEASRRAIPIARRENDLALELRTLIQSSYIDLYHLRYREGLEASLRAAELVKQVDDPYAESVVHCLSAINLHCLGEPKEAEAHAAASLATAERASDRALLSSTFSINTSLSISQGGWNAGSSFADRGMAASRDPRFRLSRSVLEHQAGVSEEGEVYLKQAMDIISLTPPGPTLEHASLALTIPVICRITGKADRFDLAEISGQSVLSDKSAMPLFQMLARAGLAIIAVERGDTQKCLEHHATLSSNAGTMLVIGGMCCDRLLGLLSQTMGDLTQAAAHFEEALAFCRKAGYRPELAWTCCDYADTLLQRNGEGERAKAMSLLEESLALSSELCMRPLMERVLSRREILKA